jgi:hypothetical protein
MVWEFYAGLALYVLVALAPYVPSRQPSAVQVDIVEFNTLYDDTGEPKFSQLILWRWTKFQGVERPRVAQWMRAHGEPITTAHRNGLRRLAVIHNGRPVTILAREYRATFHHINDDPERADVRTFPEPRRVPYF